MHLESNASGRLLAALSLATRALGTRAFAALALATRALATRALAAPALAMRHPATRALVTLAFALVSPGPAWACDTTKWGIPDSSAARSPAGACVPDGARAAAGLSVGSPSAAAPSVTGWSHLISVDSNNYNPDCNPWITQDGKKLFFIAWDDLNGPPRTGGYQGQWDICEAQWDATLGRWGAAVNVGSPINTPDAERRPSTSATGDTLFFSRGAYVWVSTRSGGVWGAPVQLFQGSDPCITSDLLQIYFVQNQDIWVADRGSSITQWQNFRSVGAPVNTQYAEVRPFISYDKQKLFWSDFGNSRPGGYGAADLWVSTWTGTAWSAPVNVGPPVNTDRNTCTPYLSPDGRKLYTSSESFEGSRGDEDVWVAFLDSLPAPRMVTGGGGLWRQCGELSGAWNVYDLAEGSNGALYAATSPSGLVYKSADTGSTWAATPALPGASFVYSLLVARDGSIYAGTYPSGDVFRSTDAAASWQPTADIPGATTVRALVETGDGRILAGTSPGGSIFSSGDAGQTWTALASLPGLRSGISRLFQSRNGYLYAGGWGPPYRSTDGGASWTDLTGFPFPPSEARSIDSFYETRDSVLWATGWVHGHGGYVFKSTDAGAVWDTTGTIRIGQVHAVRVYAMDEDADGNLRIGYQPGPDSVACVSSDRGATWRTEGSLAEAHEIFAFLRTASGALFAATTPNGDVFRWTPMVTGVPEEPDPSAQAALGLRPARPNPMGSAGVALGFRVGRPGQARLYVVDTAGRRVRTLVEGDLAPGDHFVTWDGRDEGGRRVAGGVYFVRLEFQGQARASKLAVLR